MLTLGKLYRGHALFWWEWLRFPAIAMAVVAAAYPTPLLVAIAVHLVSDFCLQSHEVSVRKAECGWHLCAHSLAVGALATAAGGLLCGPSVVIAGALWGFVSHAVIDACNKFGIEDWKLAILIDQAMHVAALVFFFA